MKRSPYLPLLAILAIAVGGVTATLTTDSRPGLGLDLQGGASVVLQPVGKVSDAAQGTTIDTGQVEARLPLAGGFDQLQRALGLASWRELDGFVTRLRAGANP